MTIITVKGQMEWLKYIEMVSWHDAYMSSPGLPDFDQFLIDCAIRGFREVIKDA